MDKEEIVDKKDASPPTQAQLDYQAREKRINDAISLQKPDRVPIVIMDGDFLLAQAGVTCAEANYDTERASKVFLEHVNKYYDQDAGTLFASFPGRVGEILGVNTMKWAGFHKGVQEYPFQFIEKEYMLADEYDQLLKDPGDFAVRTLWPRLAEGLKPAGMVPPLNFISHGYAVFNDIPLLASLPPVREMLENLLKAGEEIGKYMAIMGKTMGALAQRGYPSTAPPLGITPFDFVSDFYRGIKGTMLDMYYQPDKLKALIELLTPTIIGSTIKTAKIIGVKSIGIPLHRGADGFMSNAQFAEFYWPGLKQIILAYIDAGFTPMPYFEGSYTDRLEFLAELPPGKIWGRFDTTDMKKAKEKIGNNLCFWGNVPLPMLISGTPEQIRDYVKKLIDTFGDNGGLIVGSAGPIPRESKKENVIAMAETVFEYGVY